MKTAKFNSRSTLIDAIRGFTIILMIIFHFSFDLNNFGFLKTDIIHSPFWYAFPRLIVFLFLFAVGMSLTLAHHDKIHWKAFWKRFLKICSFALLISVVTYILFPENWIYFGTLHAIALISLMSLPFLKKPKLALVIALLLFIPSVFFDKNIPWISLAHGSWDYISPFPWFGASLLGIFAAHKGLHLINVPHNHLTRSLNFLGKHSFFIYLTHQPILFGAVYLFSKVTAH
ncbi:MAG: heparan-alpha-glucosaminide N-acetyltransferase [Bacteriovorax sp.]|nr:heparan-alpha-glucosaminide N-acetyltransferase [Bacteriovorax sp.]